MNLNIINFIHSDLGKKILAIIWGLGLAILFKRVCKNRSCIIRKAPNLNELDQKIVKYDGKCYKYKKEHGTCSPIANTIKL